MTGSVARRLAGSAPKGLPGFDSEQADAAAIAAGAAYLDLSPGQAVDGLDGFRVSAKFDCRHGTSGFSAVAFSSEDDERTILSFCGSNELIDYASGVNLGLCQYQENREGLMAHLWLIGSPSLHIVGHSLGGALAQYFAYDLCLERGNAGRALNLWTFNAVGGVSGLTRMHGAFDRNRLASVGGAQFAHPDDVIPRIGGNVSGMLALVRDPDPSVAPLSMCHTMAPFLPGSEGSPLKDAVLVSDKPYAIDRTAHLVGPLLRDPLRDWLENRGARAALRILAILPQIPAEERAEIVRMLSDIARRAALPGFSRRLARWR